MKTTSGHTLLEVLVSMLILTMALLNVDLMAVKSLHDNRKIYQLNIAINAMQNMSERLQALRNNQGLNELINQWNQEFTTVLPQAKGYLTGTFPNYEITLFWGSKEHDPCNIDYNCLKTAVTVV